MSRKRTMYICCINHRLRKFSKSMHKCMAGAGVTLKSTACTKPARRKRSRPRVAASDDKHPIFTSWSLLHKNKLCYNLYVMRQSWFLVAILIRSIGVRAREFSQSKLHGACGTGLGRQFSSYQINRTRRCYRVFLLVPAICWNCISAVGNLSRSF
jgi:hypothetical protein